MKYDFKKIEKKWQKKWRTDKTYEPDLKRAKKPFYNLMMFPYPSAEGLHVGNMYAFTGSDIYGRFKRMQGHTVFEPIGLDGFGIHSENYAIKIGKHPMEQAKISEKNFYRQLEAIGNGFAWKGKLETYDPDYYGWTQWIFTEMWKHGLAYRKKQPVNWCPSCKTVLADEQVASGKCERCSTVVVKKDLEQWFFRITNYADRLLTDLETLDWSEKVKIAQRNWIGKSEGAEIDFEIKTKEKPNFVLLHGWMGSPNRHFFPWLKGELEKRGYRVQAPELPSAADPHVYDQVQAVFKQVSFDRNTVLVGHSLGGVVAMKVLERLPHPVRKTVFIASFTENRFSLGENFESRVFDWKFNFPAIKARAGAVSVVRDLHDDSVPYFHADLLAEKFGVGVIDIRARSPHARSKIEPDILPPILDAIRVFTTRPDTLFGATYMVVSPEHKIISNLKSQISNLEEVEKYVAAAKKKTDEERIGEGKDKTGVELKDIKAINPATKEEIPVWVADYVLGGYGTGAIMAVPAHDERDFEFAKKFNLPAKMVVCPHYPAKTCPVLDHAYTGGGHLVDSSEFNGMKAEEAKWKITEFVDGKRKMQFRLRDWLISRQRYWGPPIPMIHCDVCAEAGRGEQSEMPGWYAVPSKELPVKLPYVKDFRPTGTGKSPLASVEKFYKVRCPGCNAWARRETDVSDTFLDSAWYYLGYLMASQNWKLEIGDWKLRETLRKWLPVNMYIGGAEHSVLHLLYVRFLAKAFKDWGLVYFNEPMTKFRAHGLIVKDGSKMSKSKGNIVNPDFFVEKFGADTLRMYLMFLGPFEDGGDFRDQGILGPHRFLERFWKLAQDYLEEQKEPSRKLYNTPPDFNRFKRLINQTIKKVTEDVESLNYNTAVSALMILLNEAENQVKSIPLPRYFFEVFLKLLAPFAPHLTEELWEKLKTDNVKLKTGTSSIHLAEWPTFDPKLVIEDTVELIIQVNGKMRGKITVPRDIVQPEAERMALESEEIKKWITGTPKKVVFVPGRMINFVVE